MLKLPFDTYAHASDSVCSQRLINGYAETQPRSARAQTIVIGTPGVRPWTNVGLGTIRGLIEMNDLLYVVSADQLWLVKEDGTSVIKGSGIALSGIVSMEQNGFEIVIVNGASVFSYRLDDDTLIQVAADGAFAADTVTLANQHFILNKKGTNQFFISAILDGRSYDVLDFASAETNPDIILATRAYNGVVYMFGRETTEIWNYTGSSLFPFSQISGATVNRGIKAAHAHVAEDNGLFFLGNDNIFYRVGGQRGVRLSSHALEAIWEKYETTADAFCFTLAHNGHKFIYVTFPSANATFGYDIATGLWHERVSYDGTVNHNRWRASAITVAYNRSIVADEWSSALGIIDSELSTEFGSPMVMRMVTPPDYDSGVSISIKSLHLECQSGVGLATGQGDEAVVMMRYSTDGGVEWSAEEQASMGATGDRRAEVMWTGLGSADQFVCEFSVSDPVKRVFTGVYKNRNKK